MRLITDRSDRAHGCVLQNQADLLGVVRALELCDWSKFWQLP